MIENDIWYTFAFRSILLKLTVYELGIGQWIGGTLCMLIYVQVGHNCIAATQNATLENIVTQNHQKVHFEIIK